MGSMKVLALILIFAADPAWTGEQDPFLGVWGTTKQCNRAPLKEGGSVLAEPFEIRPGWLRQGSLWCKLSWFPIQDHGSSVFASTRALCGEDSARVYRLDFSQNPKGLYLIWDEQLVNGPLIECSE